MLHAGVLMKLGGYGCFRIAMYLMPEAANELGWIFLIVHAIGSANINRRNYARSYFCVYVLAIILGVLLTITGVLSGLTQSLNGTFA